MVEKFSLSDAQQVLVTLRSFLVHCHETSGLWSSLDGKILLDEHDDALIDHLVSELVDLGWVTGLPTPIERPEREPEPDLGEAFVPVASDLQAHQRNVTIGLPYGVGSPYEVDAPLFSRRAGG